MKRQQIFLQTAVALMGIVVVIGFLAADGAFSATWTIRANLFHATTQMSDFGPPTRLDVVGGAGNLQRLIVAEPVYIDARIPSFFDEIDAQVILRNVSDSASSTIGFELGRGSAQYRFHTTHREDRPDGSIELRARLPLNGIPHEDNRFRLVLSLPGATHATPVTIESFTLVARRSGGLRAFMRRFIHRFESQI